ncbi:hypothetical protein QAD02_019261 [Eretmocerus hayati]|uniref:Uncharacterized protein n=1 Tax=Eretmocerus hayati TaxID=131215 RepID=A0ACC2PIP5_9HYME|nr:hypothetical protein QAD02_019261 [Eretmocerus hayati]
MAANEHQHQKEDDEPREPAHHARRPMNAFLIFCKRHRAAVRTGFPHLENRAVTRVLGEWWAMISDDQKQAYINLAQEYKDAFLNANPDFKWYKLPAPPLRTLSTRPTNKKSDTGQYEGIFENSKDSYFNSNTNKSEEDSIQPGKLADESQLGGLSSLFTPQKVNPQDSHCPSNNLVADNEGDSLEVPKPPKKRYTELPISAGSKEDCKVDLFGDKSTRAISNYNGSGQNPKDTDNGMKRFRTCSEDANREEGSSRGGRSCKGARYQKFLAEQSLNQSKVRRPTGFPNVDQVPKDRRNSISSNVSDKTESLSSEGTSSRGDLEFLVESAEGNLEPSKPEETETEGAERRITWISRKRFKAEDFNLERKIESLPSLSLEDFQAMKKQQRVKKKKITQKSDTSLNKHESSRAQPGMKNDAQSHKAFLVGSQKRKARKQTITRNSLSLDQPIFNAEQPTNEAWCASPDLEALACLAAVAANRSKLTKS